MQLSWQVGESYVTSILRKLLMTDLNSESYILFLSESNLILLKKSF